MRSLARACVLVAAVAFQGCFASTVVIQVAANGTGKIILTSQINRAARAEFEQSLGIRLEKVPTPEEMLPEPNAADLTQFLGARIRILDTRLETSAEKLIRTTTVAFDDVTAMRLPFPPMAGNAIGATTSFVGMMDEAPLIKFAMRPHENGDRLLVVILPDQPLDQHPPDLSPTPKPDPAEQQRIQRAVKGSALRMFVELDVPVLRTNAPARDGNRVTIFDFDFERMARGDAVEKLDVAVNPASMQEMLWTLSDLPGAVVATEHEVFLEFEAPQTAAAQAPPRPAAPDTEVYLAPLTISGDRFEVGTPKNISRSPGYDNQPSFTRDGGSILFTSARGGPQTDIYRYTLSSDQVAQVTSTPESEYSPTETPDGGLSVIRVEADGTQRLWRFSSEGRDPRVLLEAIKPVGYHAWVDDRSVALFILGRPGPGQPGLGQPGPGQPGTNQPSTLQIADTRTGAVRQVASDIGRSLLRIPGVHTISFVQRERRGEQIRSTIKELDPASGSIRTLVAAMDGEGDVDCAWAPDGTLLLSRGDRLYAWKPGSGADAAAWREVASLQRLGLHGVTRLAVHPKGTFIALVGRPN